MAGNPNFVKGNKLGGRQKGIPNKDTSRFKEALNELFEKNADNMIGWLEQIDEPKERFDILNKFAEFIFPKLQRTEMTGADGGAIEHKHNVVKRVVVDPKVIE